MIKRNESILYSIESIFAVAKKSKGLFSAFVTT